MKIVKFVFIYVLTMLVNLPYAWCTDEKIIYLTSDDGPLGGTENIINVMSKTKTPITLFMVGLHYDRARNAIKNLVHMAQKDTCIEIGNHSYSHANDRYKEFYHKNIADIVGDLKKNNKVFGLTGQCINTRLPGRSVFRLPNLSIDDPYISPEEDKIETIDDDEIYKNGFCIYGWDLEWAHHNDGNPVQSVDRLVEEIEQKFDHKDTILPNRLILLMYDEMFQDKFDGEEKLRKLVTILRSKNYKFDFIRNYHPVSDTEVEDLVHYM